jgi:hypothetical protein
MNKDDVIATLNDPIETSRDGEAGFRTDLPDIRSTVERQYQRVRQHHDRVRQLRNAGLLISLPSSASRRGPPVVTDLWGRAIIGRPVRAVIGRRVIRRCRVGRGCNRRTGGGADRYTRRDAGARAVIGASAVYCCSAIIRTAGRAVRGPAIGSASRGSPIGTANGGATRRAAISGRSTRAANGCAAHRTPIGGTAICAVNRAPAERLRRQRRS